MAEAKAKNVFFERLGKGILTFCLIVLILPAILFGVAQYVFGWKIVAETDEEICLEDGICPDTVMSYDECMKEKGGWVKVDERMICYLPWSTPYEAMTGRKKGK